MNIVVRAPPSEVRAAEGVRGESRGETGYRASLCLGLVERLLGAPPHEALDLLPVCCRPGDQNVSVQTALLCGERRDALSGCSRTSFAASTLAGLSVFGVSWDRSETTLSSCSSGCEPEASATAKSKWQRDDAHDGLDRVHGQPALARVFVPVLVVAGWMLHAIDGQHPTLPISVAR